MIQTHWNKADEEMFSGIPPTSDWQGRTTFADVYEQELEWYMDYEANSFREAYEFIEKANQEREEGERIISGSQTSARDLEKRIVSQIDHKLDEELEKTGSYIGAFPSASPRKLGTLTHTTEHLKHYSATGKDLVSRVFSYDEDVTIDFFRDWRFTEGKDDDEETWGSVINQDYPSGHLFDALDTANAVFEHRRPVRWAFRKFMWWLLGVLLTAALALFFVNEYAALGVTWDGERSIADITGLGNVRIYGVVYDAVHSLGTVQLQSEWEVKALTILIILFGPLVAILFFCTISWRWLKKYYDELDAASLLIFPLSFYPVLVMYGMPLFFVIYPHGLTLLPMWAIVVGSAISIVCMLIRTLKWLGRTIQRVFHRRTYTDEVPALTAQFEDQAFRLHRYVRLRILWANAEHGGKYPSKLDLIEKRLQKADRIVRRYGVE